MTGAAARRFPSFPTRHRRPALPPEPANDVPRPQAFPDHLASTLAFLLLLASWCVAYATFLPPDVRPARAHLALEVRP